MRAAAGDIGRYVDAAMPAYVPQLSPAAENPARTTRTVRRGLALCWRGARREAGWFVAGDWSLARLLDVPRCWPAHRH